MDGRTAERITSVVDVFAFFLIVILIVFVVILIIVIIVFVDVILFFVGGEQLMVEGHRVVQSN
jgi:hypothetical protein